MNREILWRRGRDSNPGYRSTRHNGFRDRRIQPLCHLSAWQRCFMRNIYMPSQRRASFTDRNKSGGEAGIRTPDTLLGHTRFPIVLLRPARTPLRKSATAKQQLRSIAQGTPAQQQDNPTSQSIECNNDLLLFLHVGLIAILKWTSAILNWTPDRSETSLSWGLHLYVRRHPIQQVALALPVSSLPSGSSRLPLQMPTCTLLSPYLRSACISMLAGSLLDLHLRFVFLQRQSGHLVSCLLTPSRPCRLSFRILIAIA